jgi:hypothetical protein
MTCDFEEPFKLTPIAPLEVDNRAFEEQVRRDAVEAAKEAARQSTPSKTPLTPEPAHDT